MNGIALRSSVYSYIKVHLRSKEGVSVLIRLVCWYICAAYQPGCQKLLRACVAFQLLLQARSLCNITPKINGLPVRRCLALNVQFLLTRGNGIHFIFSVTPPRHTVRHTAFMSPFPSLAAACFLFFSRAVEFNQLPKCYLTHVIPASTAFI